MDNRTIDALIRIKNGYNGFLDSVLVPRSFEVSVILSYLLRDGFIAMYSPYDNNNYVVMMKYLEVKPAINLLNIISTSSRPVYMDFANIKKNYSSRTGNLVLFRTSDVSFKSYLRNSFYSDFQALRKTGIIDFDRISRLKVGAEVLLTVN
jgi:ribosomal protein S8